MLLLCLVLMDTSWVMLAPNRLQAEAGHVGHGPTYLGFSSSTETDVIETDQVSTLPIWSGFDLPNFWMRADLRARPEWRNLRPLLSGPYFRQQLSTSADQDWGIVQLWTNF